MGQLSPECKRALSEAVEAVELGSSAEVVISLKPSSAPVSVAASFCALAGALLGLVFLLFSPWPFSHAAILVDTALCGLFSYLVCRRSVLLQRLCTPSKLAERCVALAAKAEFVERGITETRERTGILVFVSQVERRAKVLADRGVVARVDADVFQKVVARIERVVSEGQDCQSLAEAVKALLPVLEEALPRREDDINELGDGL